MKIVLVSPPGTENILLGESLSENINIPYVDLDELIEEDLGISISEYIDQNGIAAFRDIETRTLEFVLASDKDIIISIDEVLLERKMNRKLLSTQPYVIRIKIDIQELVKHLKEVENTGLSDVEIRESLSKIDMERTPWYQEFSQYEFYFNSGMTQKENIERFNAFALQMIEDSEKKRAL